MVYLGFFENLMITLISSKNLGAIKLWETLYIVYTAAQSHLYGRVTKKYDIYRNNNKKNQATLEILRLLAQKKNFYEVNFFHFLIKLNSSLI